MRCPNCNERLEGNEAFCPNCGCKVESPQDDFQQEFPQEFQDDFQEEFPEGKKEKSRTPLIIAIIVLAAIVVGGAIGIFGFNMFGGKDDKSDETQVAEDVEDDKADEASEEDDADEAASDEEATSEESEEEEEVNEPISMEIVSSPGELGQYYKLSVENASATSVVDQEGHDNSARMVLDGKDETSWQEGVDGVGIGEELSFDLSQESKVKYISFKLGNWRTEDYHWQNNRPKTIEIETDGCTQMITFTDEKKEFWVEFSDECPTDDLDITIKDVYRGTSSKWNDTCIAEIGIYGTSE